MIRAMIRATSGGREELAGGLPGTLGKFADQVLVAPADDISLDILQTQTLLADRAR